MDRKYLCLEVEAPQKKISTYTLSLRKFTL